MTTKDNAGIDRYYSAYKDKDGDRYVYPHLHHHLIPN